MSKPIWILIVVLLPVLGGILWFVVGRTRRSAAPVRRAPDDDPDFLGSIGSVRDQDERIRRLEEELAALDAEAEDPRDNPPASTSSDDDAEGPAGTRGPRA